MLKNLVIFIVFITVSACVKDKPNTTVAPSIQLTTNKKVYVVNEGNFMNSNSSVSLYDPGSSQVIEDFYKTQNNFNLGDVAQSVTKANSDFYVVVNNSGKIVVCDNNFKFKATISGLTSPRFLLPISNSKAYVSDLYANVINVINLNSNSISGTIPCNGWTEKMILIYNKAFITNMKTNYVYIVNTLNDTKADSINVGPSTGNILIDKNDKVWVLSAGTATSGINASLKKINAITNLVETTISFAVGDAPSALCMNKTKDTLYFLNNGIYQMPISAVTLPPAALINKGNKNFYGLGINPNDYTIYAADALDYIQKSNVYIFDISGNQKSFFKAGINSNGFYFE